MQLSLSHLFRGRAATRAPARPRRRVRPQIESLEERAVPSATTTDLFSSANPATQGQAVTLAVTVLGGAFPAGAHGGTVTFYDGTTALATVPLTPDASGLQLSTARFTDSALGVGSHSLAAKYSGEIFFNAATHQIEVDDASTSSPVTEVVNPLIVPVPAPTPTVTKLAVPADAVTQGQPVTLAATVTGGAFAAGDHGGTVTFYDGANVLGTVPVTPEPGGPPYQGTAAFTTSALGTGSHSLTARYGGERETMFGPSDAPSASDAVTEVVNPLPPAVADVSSQVSVTRGKGKRQPRNPLRQQLTLKNVGGTAISGPIYVVLDGLSPNVVLLNAAGTSRKHDHPGDPFVLANVAQLAPGQSTTRTLLFRGPRRKAVTFTTDVLAGPGQV